MKTRHALLLIPVVFIPIALIAQGPLTPPAGAPAPVMKTLQQVEPRIDVATLTGDPTSVFLISAPGSYYLSARVAATSGKAGVAIAAAEVTVDLNGFTITGAAGATTGVELRNGAHGATVRNGVISGVLAGPGVGAAQGASTTDVRLEDLTIRNCAGGVILPNPPGITVERVRVIGGTSSGIDAGGTAVVSHCRVENLNATGTATLYGIRARTVDACDVTQLHSAGGSAAGIFASQITHSSVFSVTGAGGSNMLGISGDTVTSCKVSTVRANSTGAIVGILSPGKVSDCQVTGVGDAGPGGPTGIVGAHVCGCFVAQAGNVESTASITGINATFAALGCSVQNLGAADAATTVTGLVAGTATDCRVSNLQCARGMSGISVITADNCAVNSITQSAGATGFAAGFVAVTLTGCRADGITGTSTSNTSGFLQYTKASGCIATSISNSGTGNAAGFRPSPSAQTLNCIVRSVADFGVNGSSGNVICGCTVEGNGSTVGTGIFAGFGSIVEDNAVAGCNTGIDASTGSTLVIRNRIFACTTDIAADATNQAGPLVTAQGNIATANPWANFAN